MFVAGILLAVGGSTRSDQLLGPVLDTARACGFDQLLVTVDGAADTVRGQVDLSGATIVEKLYFGTGCSGPLAAAVERIDPRADGVVLLAGDQPAVRISSVRGLVDTAAPDTIGVCRYQDGLGHPLWFGRELFGDLVTLPEDKAVWTLLHSGRFRVTASRVDGAVPAGEGDETLVRG